MLQSFNTVYIFTTKKSIMLYSSPFGVLPNVVYKCKRQYALNVERNLCSSIVR